MFHFGQPPIWFLSPVVHTAPTAPGFEVRKLTKTRSAKFVLDRNDPRRHTWEYVKQRSNKVWGAAAFWSQAMKIFIFQSTVVTIFSLKFPTGKFFFLAAASLSRTWASFANSVFYDRVAEVIWGLTLALSSHEQPHNLTKWPHLEI